MFLSSLMWFSLSFMSHPQCEPPQLIGKFLLDLGPRFSILERSPFVFGLGAGLFEIPQRFPHRRVLLDPLGDHVGDIGQAFDET